MGPKAYASKGMVLVLACAAQFMVVLDVAIVNVALPSIQQDLGIGHSTLQWIVIAYGLMLGGFLLLGGRMADLLGRRRMLLTGLTLFSFASLLAGVAGSAELLIGARALQGFGAALIPPAALSILAVTFAEGAERNRAVGLYGAVAGVSASIGVIASGLLTDGPGWHWVFLINVPIGVLLIAMAAVFLPVDVRDRRRSERFDVAGAVTVTGGLLLLVYALNRAADFGWGSVSTLGLFAASVLMLSAFVRIERRSRSPLVPGSAVRNRTLVAANLVGVLHVRSVLLLHLPRFAADATGSRLFADADGRRLAGHNCDVVRGGWDHGREARRDGGRAAPTRRRPIAPRDLRTVADAGSGRRRLRNRPAAGAAPGRRGRGTGCSGRTDRRSVRCHALDDRSSVRARRNHARDRGRRRRGCRVDGPRLAVAGWRGATGG